jgi:hypothetical protein
MIQLAWRFLMFQKDSAGTMVQARTADARGATRKTMIIALARKLLVALCQLATTGRFRRVWFCAQRRKTAGLRQPALTFVSKVSGTIIYSAIVGSIVDQCALPETEPVDAD